MKTSSTQKKGLQPWTLPAIFGFSLIINCLMLIVPIYSLQLFDRVINSGSIETLLMLTLLAVGAIIALSFLSYFRNKLLVYTGLALTDKFNEVAAKKALRDTQNSSSSILRTLSHINTFFTGGGPASFMDALWIPVYIFFLWMLAPLLGLLVAFGVIIIFLVSFSFNFYFEKKNANDDRRSLLLEQMVKNKENLRNGTGLEWIVGAWRTHQEKTISFFDNQSSELQIQSCTLSGLKLLLQIGILATSTWIVISHNASPGIIIAGSILGLRALSPVETSLRSWPQYKRFRSALKELNDWAQEKTSYHALKYFSEQKDQSIYLNNVHLLNKETMRPVIGGITLRAQAGEGIALLGESGAGKSSLLKIMAGLTTPERGQVHAIGPKENFSIGYMAQETVMVGKNLRDAIARCEKQDLDAIVDAIDLAGATPIIRDLPDGLETPLTDKPLPISNGAMQSLGLARAIYNTPDLLLLDEPENNLDPEGLQYLTRAIQFLRNRGTIVLVATKRYALMSVLDRVVVLKQGVIYTDGPKRNILGTSPETSPDPPQKTKAHDVF